MSGGGSQTQRTSSTENSTSNVTLPAWMTSAGQNLYQDAAAWNRSNPATAYTGQMTAGMANNQQAAQGAAAQGPAGQGDLDASRAMVARSTSGPTPQVNVQSFGQPQAQQYMTPFLRQVQDATVGQMERQNAQELQDVGDNAAASKAYGGTRHAVVEAETRGRQNANIMDYLARSNQAAYENAQGQFNTDRAAQYGADTFNAGLTEAGRDRDMTGAGLFRDIAGSEGALSNDNIRNLLLTGQADQDTQNNQLGSAYNEWLRSQNAPMDRFQDLVSILQGTPRNVTTTTNGTSRGTATTSQQNSPLSTILGIASMGASIFSDEELKENIVLVRRDPDGLGWYDYDYVDAPFLPRGRQHGVIAGEVARLRPWALGPVVGGFATVNYPELQRAA